MVHVYPTAQAWYLGEKARISLLLYLFKIPWVLESSHTHLYAVRTVINLNHISLLAAGNAFCQAAKLHMQLQSKHDSATCFVDAGNAYKKADPQGKAKEIPCKVLQILLAA